MRQRSHRVAMAGAALVVAVGLTTGCSPDFRGQIGLTMDTEGHLTAVVETCGARVDGADLIDGTVEQDHYERLGLWKHEGRVPATATWSITGSSPGGAWTTIRPWNGEVPQGHRYVLQAGRIADGMLSESHTVSYFFTFSSDDLDRLSSGMVLRRGPEDNPDVPVLQTFDDFVSSACERD